MIIDRSRPGERVREHQRHGRGLTRIAFPIGVRRVGIARRTQVTARMVRLTLAGAGLDGFHTYQCDDHVKIVFADPDGTRRDPVPNDRDMLDWPDPFPITRKYTIRRYDAAAGELDLDVVLHEGGVASTWARTAAVGDPVTVAGPPGAKVFPTTYDHFVFAVDPTALPAVARWLDESPDDVSADVVVETEHPDEHDYPLTGRRRVRVHRLARAGASTLADAATELARRPGSVFLFAAGEAGAVKPLRRIGTGSLTTLVTGYWKRGVAGNEE